MPNIQQESPFTIRATTVAPTSFNYDWWGWGGIPVPRQAVRIRATQLAAEADPVQQVAQPTPTPQVVETPPVTTTRTKLSDIYRNVIEFYHKYSKTVVKYENRYVYITTLDVYGTVDSAAINLTCLETGAVQTVALSELYEDSFKPIEKVSYYVKGRGDLPEFKTHTTQGMASLFVRDSSPENLKTLYNVLTNKLEVDAQAVNKVVERKPEKFTYCIINPLYALVRKTYYSTQLLYRNDVIGELLTTDGANLNNIKLYPAFEHLTKTVKKDLGIDVGVFDVN